MKNGALHFVALDPSWSIIPFLSGVPRHVPVVASGSIACCYLRLRTGFGTMGFEKASPNAASHEKLAGAPAVLQTCKPVTQQPQPEVLISLGSFSQYSFYHLHNLFRQSVGARKMRTGRCVPKILLYLSKPLELT